MRASFLLFRLEVVRAYSFTYSLRKLHYNIDLYIYNYECHSSFNDLLLCHHKSIQPGKISHALVLIFSNLNLIILCRIN